MNGGGMFGDDSYSKLGACVMMNDECWLIVNYVWKNWQLKFMGFRVLVN